MNYRKILLAFVLLFNLFILTGCWDKHELTKIFIVIGMAIDKAENEENKIELTVYVINTSASNETGQGNSDKNTESLIFSTTCTNVAEGISIINLNKNRQLFLQHNKVIIFSEEIGMEGIADYVNSSIRDNDFRVDNIFLFSNGKAKDILTAELKGNKSPSEFIYETIGELRNSSKHYMVNLIDMVNAGSNHNRAILVPIGKFEKVRDQNEFKFTGLAVIKSGKLINELPFDDFLGYIILADKVSRASFVSKNENQKVTYFIRNSRSSKKVKIENDKVSLNVKIELELVILELVGFKEITLEFVEKTLKEMAKEEIKKRIYKTMDEAKNMNSDFFNINSMVYKYHPKKYKLIEDNWDEVFKNLNLEVEVNVKISNVGQIYEIVDWGGSGEQ